MKSTDCSVAVIMTCFNEGPHIGAAVRSVLQQTRADVIDSIVIADDGSNSETVAVLRSIEKWDTRIRVLYGPGGAGLPAQRNLASRSTSAPLLAILDGDDLWRPDKLERQLPAMSNDAQIGLVYSGYFAFSGGDLRTAERANVRDISAEPDLARAYFLNDPPIIPSTTLIRRSAFDACGGFDATIRVFEDTDLYLRLARIAKFRFVDAPLLYKRNTTTSITGSRRDLMAHHALVAFKAASHEPRLLPLVARRLAERARKLGNHRFVLGELEEARQLQALAIRLDPLNLRAWASFLATTSLARPALRLVATRMKSRRLALGAAGPSR